MELEHDLALKRSSVPRPAIRRLKDSHHQLARLMAQGMSVPELSATTGYSQTRISTLRHDPQFKELIEFYRGHLNAIEQQVFADAAARLAAVRNDAIEEIHDRLLDTPDLLSADQVLELIKMTSDRTGYGPASKSTNLNVTLDLADRVAAGRQRLERLSAAPAAELPGTVTVLPPVRAGDGASE